jgi:glucokinase
MKAAILVNGVPASGKSTVSRAVARRLGVPLMTLDTVKEPLFHHIGTGDREHNRKLGRASYEIIFAAIGEWPADATVVVDAWFGFQPPEVLEAHLATAGIGRTAELWCHAPGAALAERYLSRAATRSPGHPGADYVPELLVLNARATPIGRGPCLHVDTTAPLETDAVMAWIARALAGG